MAMLTVNEVAMRLGVSRSTVYRLMLTGHLKYVRVGARRRIPEVYLGAYLARGGAADAAEGSST